MIANNGSFTSNTALTLLLSQGGKSTEFLSYGGGAGPNNADVCRDIIFVTFRYPSSSVPLAFFVTYIHLS